MSEFGIPYPWDEDDPSVDNRIQANSLVALGNAYKSAQAQESLSLELACAWHTTLLAGVRLAEPDVRGHFRGHDCYASTLASSDVSVGPFWGTEYALVRSELMAFEAEFTEALTTCDARYAESSFDASDTLDLSARIHSEWIRIHPFANGNGTTARIWAQWVAWRYGLPTFIRAKPRPDSIQAPIPAVSGQYANAYEIAAAQSLNPDIPINRRHRQTRAIFKKMLAEEARQQGN
jgi:hypothetical protein